jgi:plastocyanin
MGGIMRRAATLLSVFVLIGSFLVLGPRSDAAPPAPLKIQAGAIPKGNAPYEYTRFYPEAVKVHRGQTVRMNIFGFHTFTYSKVGRAGFFRADELPGTYALPEQSLIGSDCGRGAPCVLTPKTTFAGSAVPLFSGDPVDIKVDLPPGRYTYFCQIHATMSGTIDVVGPGDSIPSQKQVNAQIASAVRKDTAAADALFRRDQVPVSKVGADGVRTWRVLVGDATPDTAVQFLAYLPGKLSIAAGDRVRFEMRGAFKGDPHTVTFPAAAAGTSMLPMPNGLAGFSVNLSCDPDDTTSGLPGAVGFWGILGPPCPANLEALWAPWMTSGHPSPGNLVATPATYHDSGVLAGTRLPKNFRSVPDRPAFPSTFDAEFPGAGSFTWACTVHGDFMTGTVDVS